MSEAGDSDRGGKFLTIAAEEESDSIPPALYSPTCPATSEAAVAVSDDESARAGQQQQGDNGVEADQRQGDSKMDSDTVEEISNALINQMDHKKNLSNIEELRKKFGKLKPHKELIEAALEVTNGNGYVVSRADRPPPADEPGCGELQDEHREQAAHKAKHQNDGVALKQEKHKRYMREVFWKTKFVTPHPKTIEWNRVYRRVTHNRDTGELIEDVRIEPESKPKDFEYSLCNNPLEDMCLNIQTIFYYREPNSEKPDIAEIYSPPRITEEANKRGLKGGFALDLTVRRKDGKAWFFRRES